MKKLIGIKANNGYFISEIEKTYSSTLTELLFDGKKPEPTFKMEWVKIEKEPELIQQYVSQPTINRRYELIDKSLSDKFKDVWDYKDAILGYCEDDTPNYAPGFIDALYVFKQDTQPNILEEIEFQCTTLQEITINIDNTGFSYQRAGQYDSNHYRNITEKELKYDIIQEIITPSILVQNGPCSLSRKETYDIIRAHIKANLNHNHAKISSDYDFCLTVQKRIDLLTPHTYQVDVKNKGYGKKTREPKYEKRLQLQREIKVFECAPSPYQSYAVIEPFKANSQSEMKEVIDNYLSHLMAVINEPLKDCECCNGTGVIYIKNQTK